jgi:hypothetical protein
MERPSTSDAEGRVFRKGWALFPFGLDARPRFTSFRPHFLGLLVAPLALLPATAPWISECFRKRHKPRLGVNGGGAPRRRVTPAFLGVIVFSVFSVPEQTRGTVTAAGIFEIIDMFHFLYLLLAVSAPAKVPMLPTLVEFGNKILGIKTNYRLEVNRKL